MELFRHPSKDAHTQAQIAKKKKLSVIAIAGEELSVIADYVEEHIPGTSFGICHGVRNGSEVQALRRLLGIDVIGTDISPTASQFPNVLQWDFHDVKQEWIENVDFVYLSSWDHSFDPERLFKNWMEYLKSRAGGSLFLGRPLHAAPLDAAIVLPLLSKN
jgi:hypothetical protein